MVICYIISEGGDQRYYFFCAPLKFLCAINNGYDLEGSLFEADVLLVPR